MWRKVMQQKNSNFPYLKPLHFAIYQDTGAILTRLPICPLFDQQENIAQNEKTFHKTQNGSIEIKHPA